MNNIVTTSPSTNVIVVTSPGPAGQKGDRGATGLPGTINSNSGLRITGSSIFSGSADGQPTLMIIGSNVITGSLTVSGSNTFINIGPAKFTGSVDISGSLSIDGILSGSGANLFNIPASGITGLNLSRIATGSVSASVNIGSTAFNVTNAGSSLFNVSNAGVGTFANGLIVSSGNIILNGSALLNGSAILTAANLSTNRISDSNISASVSAAGKAFNVTNVGTSLMSVDQQGSISGSGLNIATGNTTINSPSITLVGSATLNGQPITTAGDLTLDRIKSANVTASVSTGQNAMSVSNGATTLMAVSSSGYVSASGFIGDGSRLTNVGIIYNSGSNPLINSIQIADFDNNVAVTFVDGNLKFVFGTPVAPSAPSISLSGFASDRFNKVSDPYNVVASWDVGGYSLVSAKLYYTVNNQLLDSTTSGTSFNVAQTTTGSSQSYRVEVTSSSPLDGTISRQSSTTTGTLSKSRPNVPTISIGADTVQKGIGSLQIEEGATGDINFTAAYGSANSWEEVSLTTTPGTSPQNVTATGAVSISATSNYQSPAGNNDPQVFDSRTTTTTYSRIRSLRYGASSATSFNLTELRDLAAWDVALGGTIGTIAKGTTNPSGQTITINTVDTVGGSYLYIIYDNNLGDISQITQGGFNVTGNFQKLTPTVGDYKVYRSTSLQYASATLTITI